MRFLVKSFCLVFSFYLLLLSWQPCRDFAADMNSNLNTASEQSDFQTERSPQKDDDCSPFCICSCCQASVVYQNVFYLTEKTPSVNLPVKTAVFYQSRYDKTLRTSIWQPPKSKA